MDRKVYFVAGLLLMLLGAGCNANSDAVRVLESENTSLRATVGVYQGVGPTMTAQSTIVAQRMATLTSDLTTARAQIRDLTARINSGGAQPIAQPGAQNGVQTGGQPVSGQVSAQTTPIAGGAGAPAVASADGTQPAGGANASAGGNSLTFAEVVTAKAIDASTGCAATRTETFTASDSRIYVVADVRNFKGGTSFSAKWAGTDFSRENDWTANKDSTQLCIYFYIEPKTVGLKAGTYTVTFGASGQSASPVQFTVQ